MPGLKNETDFLVVGPLGSGVGRDGGVRLGTDVVGTLDTTRPTRGGGQALIEAFGGNDTRGALEVATACTAHGGTGRIDFESETFLVQAYMPARTLSADGSVDERFAPRDVCDAVHGSTESGNKAPLLAFSSKDYGADLGPVSPTLRAAGHDKSHANAGAPPAIVEVAHTLRGTGHDASEDGTGRGPPLTIDAWTGDNATADPVSAVEGKTYCHAGNNVRMRNCGSERPRGRVRRLTPLECERLQGFPDGFTLIATKKRNHRDPEQIAYLRRQRPDLTDEEIARLAADGPRYKAIGNSMAVNVMRWIGMRIHASTLAMTTPAHTT